MYEKIVERSKNMIEEFLSVVPMKASEILVIGCSSSEIVGESIGKGSNFNAARAVYKELLPFLRKRGYFLRRSAVSILTARSWLRENAPKDTDLRPFASFPRQRRAARLPPRLLKISRIPWLLKRSKLTRG